MSVAVAAAAALGLSAGLTEPARRLAVRRGLTDQPADHKAHRRATPYLGGLPLAAGTLIPVVVVVVRPGQLDARLGLILAAAIGVGGVGLVDDLRRLRTRTRLVVETALAGCVAVGGGARLGLVGPQWLDIVLTVAWIVVITNSFNLLDNTDGALAVVTAATAIPLAVTAFGSGQSQLGLLLVCLAAASAGFLLHNAPPARIFMGDAGSLFIGFVIATAALLAHPDGRGSEPAAILLLVAFVAIVDTGLVVVSRRRAGRSILSGGTDHVAHRLDRAGLGRYPVLVTLFAVAAGTGILAALVTTGRLPGLPALSGALMAAAGLIWLLLRIPGYPAPAGVPAVARADRPVHDSRTDSRG